MTLLFPEQLQALQNTLDDTAARARAAAVLDVEIERVEQFLTNVAAFVRANAGPLSNYTYLFLFDGSTSEGSCIDLRTMVGNINTGNSIFYVDEELRLVKVAQGKASWTQCSKLTEREQALGLRLERGTYFYEILSGKVEGEGDFEHPASTSPMPSKWRRPMMEFDLILEDHKKSCVDREQGFLYWHDKQKRILRIEPRSKSTEALFHHSLFWWLKHFVADRLKVYAETYGFGQGKTDIVVVTTYGSHVLELKWLGTNEHDTSYDEKHIEPGLIQIATYLDDDDDFVCGYLVIYDGRSRQRHEMHCRYNETLRHNRCKRPRILFLESEPPSKRAERIAREKRRKQND